MSEELEKLRGDHKMKLSQILKRSWKYIKKEVWWIIFAAILICANVAVDIILPQIVIQFVSYLDESNIGNATMNVIIGMAVGYLGFALVEQALMYIQSIVLQKSGQKIVYNLRMEVFTHIENMSQNQFNDMPVGSLVTRVANYTASMSDLFTDN